MAWNGMAYKYIIAWQRDCGSRRYRQLYNIPSDSLFDLLTSTTLRCEVAGI